MWELVCYVAVAVAAVFGVVCALWLLADWLGGSRIGVVVSVFDSVTRGQLDLLLEEAKEVFGGRREIVVLFSEDQPSLTVEELALLQRYDAQIYVVSMDCPAQ